MQIDAGEFFPAEIFHHRHRHELLVHGDVVQHLFFLLIADLDDLANLVERGRHAFGRLLADQQHPIVALAVGKFDTEPVHDAAAGRRDQPLGNAVGLCIDHILVAVLNLKLVKPSCQHCKNRCHAAAHAHGAAGKRGVAAFVLLVEKRH